MNTLLKIKKIIQKHCNFVNYIIIFLSSLFVRSLPFILNGNHPLGYDTGFYRRYLIQPFLSSPLSFPNAPVPGLGNDALIPRFIFDLLRLTHLPTDYILYGSYIFFASIIPCLIYALLSQKFNKQIGFIGAIFFILSPIQYGGFWFMLWKNIFALNLLLLSFIFLDKEDTEISKKTFFAIILIDILLGLSHVTTSIIYIGTLSVYLLLNLKKYKSVLVHIILTSVTVLAVHPPTFITKRVMESVGVFIEWNEFIIFSIPFALLSIFALIFSLKHFKKNWKNVKGSILSAFFIIVILFPLFRLPFYERVFLFTDLTLIFTASIGFYYLVSEIFSNKNTDGVLDENKNTNNKKYLYGAIILIAIGNLLGNTVKQINNSPAIIKASDIESIENLSKIAGPTATIITSTDEAPWYEGFTTSHIVAPGMLNDIYNFDDWNARWNSTSTADQILFLKKYPHPLYISTSGPISDIIGMPADCVVKINANTWRDDCGK